MNVRKAETQDLTAVSEIYEAIHDGEEKGETTIGWIRGVYPTLQTAAAALERDDLFVMEDQNRIVGAAIINQRQVDVYADGTWEHDAPPEEVMVLHTLVIHPQFARRGYGRQFVAFYEGYAFAKGCRYLRMDTNARNTRARKMYAALCYREAGVVPCVFNGIEGVKLVLLEKTI